MGIVATALHAENIKGQISDKTTGEPLVGALVKVVGSTQGGVTDIDGHYQLRQLPAGTYTLEVTYVGYRTLRVPDVRLDGKDLSLNIQLDPDTQELGEVMVTARKNLEGEKALMMERQQASFAIENMGAKEMSLKGVGNVQEGLTKITGISVADAGQLIVRGLGDRYSTTTLNGLPIASPNPDNKLIPLDIFPTATVQNITVSKVYEVGSFADYSGAHIDIGTKESVGRDFLTADFNVGGAFNTLGSDFYRSDRRGTMFTTDKLDDRYWNMSRTEFNTDVLRTDPFDTSFAIDRQTALPDFGGSLSGSREWDFAGGDALSLMASLGISHSSQILDGANVKTMNKQGDIKNNFDYDSFTSRLNLAGLLSLGYSFRESDNLSYTFLYARNAEDEYRNRSGFDSEGNDLLGSNSVFHAYSLLNNQLAGHHDFAGRWTLDWAASYGMTRSDEPDRRQVMFRRDPETNEPTRLFLLNQQETMRYFGELEEDELVGDVRSSYRWNDNDLVRFGAAYKNKKRDFRSANFYYNLDNLDADITTIYDTDGYLNYANVQNGSIVVDRNMQARNSYQAAHDILAGFAEIELHPWASWMVNVGVRVENSRQSVDYYTDGGTPRTAELNKTDFFPALNVKYDLTPEQSFRFSASRTVTRPAFVEMAPFLYRPSYGSTSLRGNEEIQNGYNYNVDLRYDFFPKNSNDMFSATLYFKYLQDPIERIQQAEGGDAVHSFRNADNGIAAGIELEFRKELFKDFRVGLNGSYMYTNVKLPGNDGIYTENQRSLQGASPYLLNADVSYTPRWGEEKQLSLALVYNMQGPRIHTVGIFGLGDVEQDALHTLNFVGSFRMNNHFTLKWKVNDLLGSTARFRQDVPDTGEKVTVESYKPGTHAEIGISYTL